MWSVVLSIMCSLFALTSFAQETWTGKQDFQNLTPRIFFRKDSTRSLSIEQISSAKYDSSFRPCGRALLNFGFNDDVYWLKFTFTNTTSDSVFLELAHAFIPNADLYYSSSSGKWVCIRSGYRVHLKDKPVKDHYQLFPLPWGTRTYYLRFIPYLHPTAVNVWNRNVYLLNANRQRMIYGAYSGLLLFAIAINIFLFFSLRHSYYLLYALLVFLYLGASAGVMEGYMIYFFPEADMMYWYKLIPVLNMPALLMYCLSFLEVRKVSMPFYRITWGVFIFLIVYIIRLHFSPLLPYLFINQILALVVFVLTIVTGIAVGRQGNKLGYYFTITYGIWFILLCFEEVHIQTGLPPHIFELTYVSVAIFIEAFMLAFLQSKRFQWQRKADARMRMEIEQRFLNEIMLAQLEMQEQTLRSVSQEIHDNIGQTLSLIKINLNLVPGDMPREGKEKLIHSKNLLSKVIHEIRDLTKTMNTDHIKDIGLTAAIEDQLKLLARTGSFKTEFSIQGEVRTYDPKKELLIFRIIQELLNNTMKHSQATAIAVRMHYTDNRLEIFFEDDGIGFNVDDVMKQKDKGLGLRNLIYRMELIRGITLFDSGKGRGTRVTLRVPEL